MRFYPRDSLREESKERSFFGLFFGEAIDFENVAGKEFAEIALRERVAAYGFFLIVFFCGSVSAF